MKQVEQKPKRIKRVFSNHSEVVHRWANQTQDRARCKNVYFSGPRVYSYGSHYELGRLIQFNGMTVAIINDSGYSVTTSKHIWSAWHAVEHMPRIRTKDDFETGCVRRGLVREQGELIDNLFNHFNRRTFNTWTGCKPWDEKDRDGDVGGYAAEVEKFNLKARQLGFSELCLNVNKSYIDLYNEKLVHGIERAKTRDAIKTAKREAARIAEAKSAADAAIAWRQGGPLVGSMSSIVPMILRVKGGMIETSRGASVTITEARSLLKAVESKKIRKGDAVGEYTFNKMTKVNGVSAMIIDCHTIAVSELKAVLSQKPILTLVKGE